MSSDGQRIAVLSCNRRRQRDSILHQPWTEIRMEDLVCMARDQRQLCDPFFAMNSKLTGGYHSETGTAGPVMICTCQYVTRRLKLRRFSKNSIRRYGLKCKLIGSLVKSGFRQKKIHKHLIFHITNLQL